MVPDSVTLSELWRLVLDSVAWSELWRLVPDSVRWSAPRWVFGVGGLRAWDRWVGERPWSVWPWP